MKVSQPELLGLAAVVLYIALFSHSPPMAIRSALSNVFVASGVFAAIAYVTLQYSRTIGVLLILAFLLTMTRVTEHLVTGSATSSSTGGGANTSSGAATTPVTPPTNTPTPLANPTPSTPETGTTMDAKGNIVDSSGNVVQATHSTTDSGVSADAKGSAAPAQTPPPDVSLNASVTLPTAPDIPPAPTFPSPVMSCNVESFMSF